MERDLHEALEAEAQGLSRRFIGPPYLNKQGSELQLFRELNSFVFPFFLFLFFFISISILLFTRLNLIFFFQNLGNTSTF